MLIVTYFREQVYSILLSSGEPCDVSNEIKKSTHTHTHACTRLHMQIASCNRFTWWVNYLGKYWICLSDYFARGANTRSRTMHAVCLSFSLIFHSNWCLQVCGCEFLSQSVSSSLESGFRQDPPPFFFFYQTAERVLPVSMPTDEPQARTETPTVSWLLRTV